MHFASRTDAAEAFLAGVKAVKLAFAGKSGLMVNLLREDSARYCCRTGSVELDRVAGAEKKVPQEWIAASGNFVTGRFISYARPLIQGEVRVPIKNGLPDYFSLEELEYSV